MHSIILSGAGGSTNWLPLISPLVVLLAAIKGGEMLNKFRKRRKLLKENKLVNDLSTPVAEMSPTSD